MKNANWNRYWGNQSTIKRLAKINTAYPEVTKLLLGLTSRGSKCIEFGCGSGTYAIELLKNKRNCIASDISEKSLELAKIKGKHLYNIDVPTQIADIYSMPYPENTFDLVFSDGVIEHLEIPKALEEMKRILKPGGWAITKIPSGSFAYRIVYHLLSPIENRPYEAWFSKEEWRKKFEDGGYKNVEISSCGGISAGLAMRLPIIKKISRIIPSFLKIYFLIRAQK